MFLYETEIHYFGNDEIFYSGKPVVAFHIGDTFNHFLLWLSRDMSDTPEEMANHTLAVLSEDLIKHMWITTNSNKAHISDTFLKY